MGIGNSLGAYYDDSFHQATAEWDPKYDDNEVTPGQMYNNKQMDSVDMTELGGIEVAKKTPMPFPDNHNPDSDFNSRFGNLPPSGILNDIKPQDPVPPLIRRIGETTTPDYDYGAWKAANPDVQMQPGQHYPDTYKLPNHMTFSDESIYNGNGNEGGHWGTDENGKDTFTPGRTNLENHSIDELKDYFNRVEPDSKLILPDKRSGVSSLIHQVNMFNSPDEIMLEGKSNDQRGNASAGPTPERINKAALRNADSGEVFEGFNHGDAFEKLMSKYPSESNFGKIDQGFTTSQGRFVSREDAMKIAQQRDQLIDKGIPPVPEWGLLSEDLSHLSP